MLQNRVNPLGEIIKTSARGAWMGNRGLLHNDRQEIVRPFKLKAWITCRLEFKGWKRKVMTPNRYTELFFLDEATSFAAGHRPCFECRREDYDRFKASWLKGNPEYGYDKKTSIKKVDDIMHAERMDAAKSKITYKENPALLPDGAFVSYNDEPYLIKNGLIHLWSPFGYGQGIAFPDNASQLQLLTPRSTVNAFRAGYIPQVNI